MRVSSIVVVLLTCCCAIAAENNSRTADLTLRYVNDSVISLGDVLQRNAVRKADYERRGRPQPTTHNEQLAFFQQSLDELTDEELLIQYGRALAEERGFQLVDHERISQMVMERARNSGRGRSLREQAEERRHIERNQIMDLVLGYFESRAPHVSPQDIERSYRERVEEFRRPARAKVLQIVLRPSSPAERLEIKQARISLFKQAQDVADAVIRQASEGRIEAYTIANAEDQERLLAEAAQEIARQAGRADLDPAAADLVKTAVEVERRAAALRDEKSALRELETLRGELVGKDAEAFKAVAKRVSQGPNATDGGDLGWVEPGSFQPAFDAVAFKIPVGELSPVFQAERLACLVLVTERIEARSRAFAEVIGEIESALNREQSRTIREVAVHMMRGKASVRDLVPVSRLFR
jgi:parvulin-like peptidyl-prolyl isomerase